LERKKSNRHALLYRNVKGKIIPLDDVNLDILIRTVDAQIRKVWKGKNPIDMHFCIEM